MVSKLIRRSPHEAEDALETLLFQSFTDLQSQLTPPYQLTLHTPHEYARLMQALLYAILTQPQSGQTHVTHLKAVVTDGYASLVHLLIRLVNESYPKLLEQAKLQVIWVFRQLVELCASDSETLCLALLRRIVGGDLTQGNVWLALELLHVLHSNWGWVIANPGLVTGALFTYLRLLPDHFRSKSQLLNVLKKTEIEFCVRVLRECFQNCLSVGRDLVRLLQDVGCIPEFELIWKDLLGNPGVFRVQGFRDVSQLYLSRTPVRYLVSRITPEMENQIRFMLTYVKWGNQRRYQAWFANKFFVAPESETLIPDLVRFVCCAHHPPNEILQSDVISRWAIVGWLLKCCRSKHVEANAKLALFYDWLFFTDKIDNLMNIEPAILLMVHSIPKYIDITQSLLDFLFLLMEHYDPNRKELLWRGISGSFEILIRKGVVRSLEPILSCNFIAPLLREKLTSFLSLAHSKVDHNIAGRIEKAEVDMAIVNNINPSVNGSLTAVQNSVASMCHKGNHFQVPEIMTKDSRQMRIDDAGSQTPVQNSVSSLCHKGNQFQVPEIMTKDLREMRIDDAGTQASVQNSVSSVCHKVNNFQVPEIMRRDSCQMGIDDAGSQTLVQNSVSSLCHKGNHFEVPEIMTKDSCEMRIDEAGVAQKKRRRVEVSNTVCMNDLLEMVKKSDEMAVDVLEKFLISFLGIPYQTVDATVGHYILPNALKDSSPETTRDLALQIENAFQAAGHEMFSPLKHAPDVLEADEVVSATAVILRVYVLSRHPKLQEMLLFWYENGLAVGPRLLCYASRLADELEQISGPKNTIDYFSSSQNLKGEMVCFNDLDVALADVMEQEGRSREIDMDVTVGRKKRIQKISLLKWHAEKYSLSGIAREHSSSGSQHSENMGVKQLSILVEDAFAAYKEFLMCTHSTSVPQLLNSNQSKMLLAERSDGGSAKGVLDGDRDVFTAFLEDLRICCLWNVSRLLQVFRSIFYYLSDLSTGREGVIKLLVCFLVPAELLKFEIKLGLKDFSVFGEDPQNLCSLVKNSLEWDFPEQQIFWQLLMSEVQVCVVPLVMPLLAFCAEALDPLVHVGAISGLLTFLRSQSPSIELVNAILCLPKRFAKFAATVIASWSVLNRSKLFICLTEWTKVCLSSMRNMETMMNIRFSTEKVNLAAVNAVISFFDRHGSNEKTDSNNLEFSNLSEIRASLSELAGKIGPREICTTDNSIGVEIQKEGMEIQKEIGI